MPSRLSSSPPRRLRGPNSPEAMSLTETSRPVLEPHIFHPSLSRRPGPTSSGDLRLAVSNSSPLALPPLPARQPYEIRYNVSSRDPSLTLHPIHNIPRHLLSPLDWQPQAQQHFSSRPSPEKSVKPEFPRRINLVHLPPENTATLQQIRSSTSQTQSLLADYNSNSSASPPLISPPLTSPPLVSPLYKKETPSPEFTYRPPVIRHGRRKSGSPLSRRPSSGPMEINELINHSEPRFEPLIPICYSTQAEGVISSPSLQYDLVIRQQPVAARACGFGDRDRRVIDPPPILQMIPRDPVATPMELKSKLSYPFSVVHCELWNAETDTEETAMPEVGDRRPQRRLMGTLVASPFVGRDENNVEGCFFPFPDLSCRTTGRYRLRFVLVVLNPASMRIGDRLPFKATILSEVFEAYPAKTFPGMIESTDLTKRLKDQGCLISVKKGHQKLDRLRLSHSHPRDESEEPEDDEEDHIPGKGVDKRQRS